MLSLLVLAVLWSVSTADRMVMKANEVHEYPGQCYDVHNCVSRPINSTWSLPKCGRSTCERQQSTDLLVEIIERCPRFHQIILDGCEMIENRHETYPACCPKVRCPGRRRRPPPPPPVVKNDIENEINQTGDDRSGGNIIPENKLESKNEDANEIEGSKVEKNDTKKDGRIKEGNVEALLKEDEVVKVENDPIVEDDDDDEVDGSGDEYAVTTIPSTTTTVTTTKKPKAPRIIRRKLYIGRRLANQRQKNGTRKLRFGERAFTKRVPRRRSRPVQKRILRKDRRQHEIGSDASQPRRKYRRQHETGSDSSQPRRKYRRQHETGSDASQPRRKYRIRGFRRNRNNAANRRPVTVQTTTTTAIPTTEAITTAAKQDLGKVTTKAGLKSSIGKVTNSEATVKPEIEKVSLIADPQIDKLAINPVTTTTAKPDVDKLPTSSETEPVTDGLVTSSVSSSTVEPDTPIVTTAEPESEEVTTIAEETTSTTVSNKVATVVPTEEPEEAVNIPKESESGLEEEEEDIQTVDGGASQEVKESESGLEEDIQTVDGGASQEVKAASDEIAESESNQPVEQEPDLYLGQPTVEEADFEIDIKENRDELNTGGEELGESVDEPESDEITEDKENETNSGGHEELNPDDEELVESVDEPESDDIVEDKENEESKRNSGGHDIVIETDHKNEDEESDRKSDSVKESDVDGEIGNEEPLPINLETDLENPSEESDLKNELRLLDLSAELDPPKSLIPNDLDTERGSEEIELYSKSLENTRNDEEEELGKNAESRDAEQYDILYPFGYAEVDDVDQDLIISAEPIKQDESERQELGLYGRVQTFRGAR